MNAMVKPRESEVVARAVKPSSKAEPPQSTRELRAFLLRQMVNVAEGYQGADEAKAVCNYAQQIYNTLNMELRHAVAMTRLGDNNKVLPVSFND